MEIKKKQYQEIFGNEKRRSSIINKARIQPFCKDNNNHLGCFDGIRIFPRIVTERNKAF